MVVREVLSATPLWRLLAQGELVSVSVRFKVIHRFACYSLVNVIVSIRFSVIHRLSCYSLTRTAVILTRTAVLLTRRAANRSDGQL